MVEKVLLNFKMDARIKEKYESICDELGLTPSAAFHVLIKKMIRENRLPFDVISSSENLSEKIGVTIRIDKDVKARFFKVCANLSLTASSVLNAYASAVCSQKGIPFDVSIDSFCSKENIEYLTQLLKEYRSGKLKFEHHDLIEDDTYK